MRGPFCTCSLFIALALMSSGAIAGAAEPSAACRSLAARFGTAAAPFDAKSLVDLGICVAVELGDRAASAEPFAAAQGSTPPQPLPPPVVTPSPSTYRGQLPATATPVRRMASVRTVDGALAARRALGATVAA